MTGGGSQDDRLAALLSDISDEERNFIAFYGTQQEPQSAIMRLFTYSAFFIPGVAIGVYGIIAQSFQAVTVAFLILAVSIVWSLTGIFGEQRSIMLTYQVFRRLHAVLQVKHGV